MPVIVDRAFQEDAFQNNAFQIEVVRKPARRVIEMPLEREPEFELHIVEA